ncbi:MAG: hypothetical protein IJX39_06250 [Clostridia bacterium]|nr:hypothetical protein [Clostridia bacterium]
MTETEMRPAVAREGQSEEPRRVLFVCTGNTCRSPMAAALYNDMMAPGEVGSACAGEGQAALAVAESAGLYANDGDPMTPDAVKALAEAGVAPRPGNDYTAHRARRVTRDMMERADAVVAISTSHAMELTLRFPEFAGKIGTMPMDIPDPYGKGPVAYRECLMQLRYCLQILGAGGEEA